MPKTSYTDFCNQAYDLLIRMDDYARGEVLPKLEGLRHDNGRSDRKRDVVVYVMYGRIALWLSSLRVLNQPNHAQAIGAGARCLFEQYLDLKWLEMNPGPEWLDRYLCFPDVDRYQAAEKVCRHKQENQDSKIETKPFEGYMSRVDAVEPMEKRVSRVWGQDAKGKPKWPRFHWTGVAQLDQRAKDLGPECVDMYRQVYPVLSWLVHAGPTTFVGADLSEIEKHTGWAICLAFRHSHASTITACRILGIADGLQGFYDRIMQLNEWSEDAMKTLPSHPHGS